MLVGHRRTVGTGPLPPLIRPYNKLYRHRSEVVVVQQQQQHEQRKTVQKSASKSVQNSLTSSKVKFTSNNTGNIHKYNNNNCVRAGLFLSSRTRSLSSILFLRAFVRVILCSSLTSYRTISALAYTAPATSRGFEQHQLRHHHFHSSVQTQARALHSSASSSSSTSLSFLEPRVGSVHRLFQRSFSTKHGDHHSIPTPFSESAGSNKGRQHKHTLPVGTNRQDHQTKPSRTKMSEFAAVDSSSTRSSSAQSSDSVTIVPTAREITLFSIVTNTLKHFNRPTVPRVAGGWVRDKLLGIGRYTDPVKINLLWLELGLVLCSHDIDIAVDDCSGVDFAKLMVQYQVAQGFPERAIAIIQVGGNM
jgi:hypothetical protein